MVRVFWLDTVITLKSSSCNFPLAYGQTSQHIKPNLLSHSFITQGMAFWYGWMQTSSEFDTDHCFALLRHHPHHHGRSVCRHMFSIPSEHETKRSLPVRNVRSCLRHFVRIVLHHLHWSESKVNLPGSYFYYNIQLFFILSLFYFLKKHKSIFIGFDQLSPTCIINFHYFLLIFIIFHQFSPHFSWNPPNIYWFPSNFPSSSIPRYQTQESQVSCTQTSHLACWGTSLSWSYSL